MLEAAAENCFFWINTTENRYKTGRWERKRYDSICASSPPHGPPSFHQDCLPSIWHNNCVCVSEKESRSMYLSTRVWLSLKTVCVQITATSNLPSWTTSCHFSNKWKEPWMAALPSNPSLRFRGLLWTFSQTAFVLSLKTTWPLFKLFLLDTNIHKLTANCINRAMCQTSHSPNSPKKWDMYSSNQVKNKKPSVINLKSVCEQGLLASNRHKMSCFWLLRMKTES